MLRHAYAILDVKAADGAPARRISGVATTPAPDRLGDILDPLGAEFTNPIPLLWHHDKERPIGLATLHKPTPDGITFEATLPTVDEPGALRDRIEEVWQSLKAGLISGVSVGYRVLDGGLRVVGNARRFTRTEICELSLVTVPANMHATVHAIKSLDASHLAASGLHPSGGPDFDARPARKGAPAMTSQEQITQFENSLAAKLSAMNSIMSNATDATLPDDKREQYDALALEVKGLNEHLARARDLERLNAAAAQRVPPTPTPTTGQRSPVVHIKSNLPPGTAFTRAAIAILATKGNRYEAIEFAKRWEKDTPEVVEYLKAAVAPGTTTDPAWAAPLVAQAVSNEFIALLRPATILGKIPNLRVVPFNVTVPVQTAGGSYGWVGQAKAKPVTALQFGQAKLDMSKAAGIVTLTEELARFSSPSAENIIRADMIAGIAQFLDQQFIDPAVAFVANVHPASITNGIVGTPTSGDPYKDLLALLTKFAGAGIGMAGATLIMSESNALGMAFARDASGARIFPNVGVTGGSVEGINVVTSNTAGTNIILVSGPSILYADDGGVTIDVSREASVQMDTAPASPPDATTVLVSLWQNNLIGLRAERFINWKRAVDAGVALVTGAAYAPALAE